MKAAEHKAEAERLVKWAFDCDYMFWSPYVANTLAAAQVHATLANIPDPISSGLGPL